jgi:FdhD protein
LEASQNVEIQRFEAGRWHKLSGGVVGEGAVRLHVNGQDVASLLCTPRELDLLALGFLAGEGIIKSTDDVRLLKVCPSGACVDVWLRRADFVAPARLTITSGCGGGVTFTDLSGMAAPVLVEAHASVRQIEGLMGALMQAGQLYQEVRGVHTSALARGEALLAVAEDVGRHNTIDKVRGRCLVESIPTAGGILLTTGRISSEMLTKAARMGTPIVASRTSLTSLSVALATAWHITLVGYVRHGSLNVYAGHERLVADEGEKAYAHA